MFSFRLSLILYPLLIALLPIFFMISFTSFVFWRSLAHERALANEIKSFSCSLKNTSLSDPSIRRFVQKKGEDLGLPLKFQDVIISYNLIGGVEKPTHIGYALPIEVSLLGMWTFHLFTHRDYPLCLNQSPSTL